MVMCPAGLQQQWKEELRDKFHLDFQVMDSHAVDRIRKDEGFDTNPWMIQPRLITSMDFLKQESIKDQFLEAARRLSQEGQSLFPGFDLLIVDEAHNLAPNGLGDDSQRTQLLRAMLPCFEHRLFLTATPHNGHTMSFTGLLELLDPVRFQQDDVFPASAQQQLQLVMVRGLKKEGLPILNSNKALRELLIEDYSKKCPYWISAFTMPDGTKYLGCPMAGTESCKNCGFDAVREYRLITRGDIGTISKMSRFALSK